MKVWMLVLGLFLTVNLVADRGVRVVSTEIETEPRVALVIGNKDYTSMGSLKNPLNDARDMSRILKKKGFDVIALENASQLEMEQAITKFSNKISSGKGVGLFYYAGHGVEVNGINYLIPSNANIPSIDFVKSKTVSVESLLSAMERAKNRFNILILDACRSNPFGRGGGGLASINNVTGIFVAYATAPGKIAQDGEGRNGLFTEYLKKYINKEGLKIEEVFKEVGREVQKKSNRGQTPWTSSSVYGDFYFTLPKAELLSAETQEASYKVASSSSSSSSHKSVVSQTPRTTSSVNSVTVEGKMYQNQPFNKEYTWQEAKEYCENLTLDGYSDWKLPSRNKLRKLTSDSGIDNIDGETYYINKAFIKNILVNNWFWTTSEKGSSSAWGLYFQGGLDFWYNKSSSGLALCMR
jgi:uncharacterized caspase-like protein